MYIIIRWSMDEKGSVIQISFAESSKANRQITEAILKQWHKEMHANLFFVLIFT